MKFQEIVSRIEIDPAKLTGYSLNPENKTGRHKARVFQSVLGITQENYQILLDQIRAKVLDAEASFGKRDQYGQRYEVKIEVEGVKPEMRALVLTAWIVEVQRPAVGRLTTTYIVDK
ncbi:MAG: hypothetical protein HC795_11695 [Coleofasciculaceae cyanobacterium RL_1_1]|nr:hypothetical protein [Coleofasciculaceae cyanobacterium RL_1_1]